MQIGRSITISKVGTASGILPITFLFYHSFSNEMKHRASSRDSKKGKLCLSIVSNVRLIVSNKKGQVFIHSLQNWQSRSHIWCMYRSQSTIRTGGLMHIFFPNQCAYVLKMSNNFSLWRFCSGQTIIFSCSDKHRKIL